MSKPKVAVVLFNLGGPDSPAAIKPFLLNLFRDPAILRVPFFVRPLLARYIASARVKPATENYMLLGGKSPLLELTQGQAEALEVALPDLDARCFVAMRYWHPFAEQTVADVIAWNPDEVILLPLYPHFSTTTTGSSLTDWRQRAAAAGLVKPVTTICCYHDNSGFVAATADIVQRAYTQAMATLGAGAQLRILFSAHGLPQTIVKKGDPYQFQIEQTVAAVIAKMDLEGLDSTICYQSRATPQVWIGPSTDIEIERAGHEKVPVLVVPIAFVSEHSETLVELDVEYRELAHKAGVPAYFRAPAANSDVQFIASLASMVHAARDYGPGLCAMTAAGICPAVHKDCPGRKALLF